MAILLAGGGKPTSMTSQIRWLPFQNKSGEVIPPYSVVRIIEGERLDNLRVVLNLSQPNDDPAIVALTGPQSTAVDGFGVATQDSPAWMAYDDAYGTPTAGQAYQPGRGVWYGVPGGRDFTVIGPAVSDETPNRVLVQNHNLGGASRFGKGCCGACAPQRYLTVDRLYSRFYTVTELPEELGGPTVTLEHVGLTSGLTGIPNDYYYWESDSFEYDCGSGIDEYIWRMVVAADGTGACKASYGPDNVILYLVPSGSALICTDLSDPRCTAGSTPGTPLVQYKNIEDWRARCGSRLYLYAPQFQQPELDALLPCKVCIVPDYASGFCIHDPCDNPDGGSGGIPQGDLSDCWKDFLGPNATLPSRIVITTNTINSNNDAFGQPYFLGGSGQAWELEFDIPTQMYNAIPVGSPVAECGTGFTLSSFKKAADGNPAAWQVFPFSRPGDLFLTFQVSCGVGVLNLNAVHYSGHCTNGETQVGNDFTLNIGFTGPGGDVVEGTIDGTISF